MKAFCCVSVFVVVLCVTPLYGQEWKRYTTAQGLPSNNVLSLVIDHKGLMWAGTLNGLAYHNGEHWVNTPVGIGSDQSVYGVWSATDTL